MGMTGDYQIALQEGNTMVRIGALFEYEKNKFVDPNGFKWEFCRSDHSAAGECDTFSFKWGFYRSGSDAPSPSEAGVHKCFKYLHRLFPADESCRQTDVSVVVLTGLSGLFRDSSIKRPMPVCLFTVMVIPCPAADCSVYIRPLQGIQPEDVQNRCNHNCRVSMFQNL